MGEVFETTDLESAEHILSSTYGSMHIDARGQRRGMRLTQAVLTPAVRFDHLHFEMSLDVVAAPLGVLVIGQVNAGRLAHASDGSRRLTLPGGVYLTALPGHSYAGTIKDTDSELAVIDPALPARIADTAPSRVWQPVGFTGYKPVSTRAGQAWMDTYAYIRDTVLGAPDGVIQPLLAAGAARLLAATALAVFPNNALTDPTSTDRHDGHPGTVRRAVAFIDEHAHEDIAVADIAAAASVTIRGVQLAFRRHLDTTPMAYLRRVRLDRAHHDLISGDPARTTVTAIAYRWGFSNASRFSAVYQQAYGVTPRHSLHRD